MPINSSVREKGEIIVTSGENLTIENAADFSRILNGSLKSAVNVLIEFEPMVKIDITGVQIICSACKSAAASGKTFSFHGNRPQALADMITSCGAERHSDCRQNNNSTCIWFGGVN